MIAVNIIPIKRADQLESFTCRKTSAPAFISVSGTASRLKHVMQKDDAETEEAYADLSERIFTDEDKHKASDKSTQMSTSILWLKTPS